MEPPGPDRLTLFHGVVDAPRIAFCAVRVTDGGAAQALEPMFPAGGLDYATPFVLDAAAGVDFAKDDLRLIAVAGDAAVSGSTSCADALATSEQPPADAGADAAPPALRARGLPVLPAGTLTSERSLLLVVTGCFGAPDHDGPTRESICGKGYTPAKPTLGMTLVTMSRRTVEGRLGLQLVHASRATDAISLVTLPPPSIVGASHFIASEVVYGQIAPPLANVKYARLDYGAPFEASLLEVRRAAPGSVSTAWSAALARGGVSAPADGQNFSVVFTGPLIGTSEIWANPGALTVLASAVK